MNQSVGRSTANGRLFAIRQAAFICFDSSVASERDCFRSPRGSIRYPVIVSTCTLVKSRHCFTRRYTYGPPLRISLVSSVVRVLNLRFKYAGRSWAEDLPLSDSRDSQRLSATAAFYHPFFSTLKPLYIPLSHPRIYPSFLSNLGGLFASRSYLLAKSLLRWKYTSERSCRRKACKGAATRSPPLPL